MDENQRILAALRAILAAGGPQQPVQSLSRPPVMTANTGTRRLSDQSFSVEPLAQRSLVDAILGQGAGDMLGSLENVGSGGPTAAGWSAGITGKLMRSGVPKRHLLEPQLPRPHMPAEFVAPGEEAFYNTVVAQQTTDPMALFYQEMLKRLGGLNK